MGKSANADTVGIHLQNEIIRVLDLRAEAIGQTRSAFGAMVFQQWALEGFPALDEKISRVDKTMRAEVMQRLADEQSRVANPQHVPKHPGEVTMADLEAAAAKKQKIFRREIGAGPDAPGRLKRAKRALHKTTRAA